MGTHFMRGVGLLALVALSLTPASADVIYSTTGAFTGCGTGYTCNGATLTGPGFLTITFAGLSDDLPIPDDNTPTAVEFGAFTVMGPLPKDTLSEDFSITVSQTVPSVGSSSVLGVIAGQLKLTSSSVSVSFAPGGTQVLADNPVAVGTVPAIEFMLGDVTYWVDATTAIDPAFPKSGQPSPIDGAISYAPGSDGSMPSVPEPSSEALLIGGIAAIVGRLVFVNRGVKQSPR